MSCSRRQFIQLSAGMALASSVMPYAARAAAPLGDVPLPVPPLIESRRGQPLFLTLQRSHWSFNGNSNKVPVWGINGLYLGPTVRVYSGDDVKLIYSNRLNEPVAMTVSGLQVPGALMSGAPRMMSAGVDWAPVLPIRQGAATLWYHANTPNRMAPHVYNGLAGMWLIEDDISKALPLPKHYGVDDFPLIIQDKRLDNFATPVYNPLAPGERREVLVDMSQGDEVSITAGTAAGIMDRLRGLFEPSSILTNTLVLTLRPTGLLPLVTDNLPMRLLADQILDGVAVRTREFRLGDGTPGINGVLWDMNRIDTTVQQGTFERWIIHADRPQSLHIQGVMFLIKSVNGAQSMGEDRGWKDTVWVDGDVELLVSFPQSSSEHFPFVYYSQTLELADRGTAGQMVVNPVG